MASLAEHAPAAPYRRKTAAAGDMLMPCQEYCGFGHSQMIAHVRVVPAEQFRPGPDGKVTCG